MVNLTIDGKQLSVAEGTTILKAAESLGIYIPTLCYHPKISPIGACRVCLVEVEGEKRLVASCDTPVREGMVVRTHSDEIERQRKQMLQLVLLHHPLDCPVCDKAGECDVQDITVEMCILEQPFTAVKLEKITETLSSVLDLWHSRCIMCGRCVQICKEVQGARAIDYVVRSGFASKVGPTERDGYPCESCSQCLSVCPVGAILDSTFRYSARAWQLDKADSVCTFCGVGCSYELNVRENKVYRVTVRDDQGLNKGNLCSVGRFGRDSVHSETRLSRPSVRTNGSLREVSWDDAVAQAAEKLKGVASASGPKSVAGLASARCTNEALFAFQKLLREGVGTDQVDSPAHLNNLGIIETMADVYGVSAPSATLSDIDEADAILIVDSNIITSHPVIALEALRAHHAGSADVFVVGHRSNKLTTQCRQFARTLPGSEAVFLNCLASLLIEKGAVAERELRDRCEGFDKLKDHVARFSLQEASTRTNVDPEVISAIAEGIAGAKNFLLVLSPGSVHSGMNSSVARAAVNLAAMKGGKVLSLLREGNAQGAVDMGVIPAASNGGILDIVRGLEAGEIKALYLMGGDIRKELALLGLSLDVLRTLDCLIVQDVFGSPIAEIAQVVLPACSFAERDGSYTNSCRVAQHSSRAIEPADDCRSDLEILSLLGEKLGLSPLQSVGAARSEIASSVPAYDFMEDNPWLDGAGAWDYSKAASNDKPKMSVVGGASRSTDQSFPYLLTFDDMLHYGGATSLHSPSLAKIRVSGVVEIGEEDAAGLGVENGGIVEVKVRDGGSAKLPVRRSRELPAGVISVPAYDFETIRKLISKIDASALKADAGTPTWCASVSKA